MGKPELNRIEFMLNQLDQSGSDAAVRSTPNRQGYSFKIWSSPLPQHRLHPGNDVQPFPAQAGAELPALPKFKLPHLSSHRHAANPNLAMAVLKEIEAIVAAWQAELQQIVGQIQDLYLEGPMIDGWLESPAQKSQSPQSTPLRYAEVDRLMNYVEDICAAQPTPMPNQAHQGYRLCGLDADGKSWSRPCPPDQVPHVSLAIARYQRLRQLLGRKHDLDARLSQIANTLVALHGHVVELR